VHCTKQGGVAAAGRSGSISRCDVRSEARPRSPHIGSSSSCCRPASAPGERLQQRA
jgi:hypothetical protein